MCHVQVCSSKVFANTLFEDLSAVTEPLSLVGFMGQVTVCSSKGFANTLFADFSAVTESLRLVWFMGHDTILYK